MLIKTGYPNLLHGCDFGIVDGLNPGVSVVQNYPHPDDHTIRAGCDFLCFNLINEFEKVR